MSIKKLRKGIRRRIIDPFRKLFTTGVFAAVLRMGWFIVMNPVFIYFLIGMGIILAIMLGYHLIDSYFIRNNIWETVPVA